MNRLLKYSGLLVLIILIVLSCKSSDPAVKQQIVDELDLKIKNNTYTFNATRANPMSGRSIDLTSIYTLDIGVDTIKAHLPYFGRAYSAPYPSDDGGIKFSSTEFTYQVSEKEKGVYRVAIETRDNPNNYKLSLLIGETGHGTLHVTQMHRQSISFSGEID